MQLTLNKEPDQNLGIVIVIPAFNEKSLIPVFESILACNNNNCFVEVLAIINQSENCDDKIKQTNKKCFDEADNWVQLNNTKQLNFNCFHVDLPPKNAGVGLARKRGMDLAYSRLSSLKKPNALIVNLDADCLVEKNYLIAIEDYFNTNININAASISFAHRFDWEHHPAESSACVDYELYLRYFIKMQRNLNLPFAYQTIGSAMAVRTSAYHKQGGMNQKKAGEDFYFLQKHIELGNFGEINQTTVLPSCRQSNRVPFGTGKAIHQIISSERYTVYHPESFYKLKSFLAIPEEIYGIEKNDIEYKLKNLPKEITAFLHQSNLHDKILNINDVVNSKAALIKRFYRYFNAFQLMKYLHFMRDNFIENIELDIALQSIGYEQNKNNKIDFLNQLRQNDQSTEYKTTVY